jgi:hypothetical protein
LIDRENFKDIPVIKQSECGDDSKEEKKSSEAEMLMGYTDKSEKYV